MRGFQCKMMIRNDDAFSQYGKKYFYVLYELAWYCLNVTKMFQFQFPSILNKTTQTKIWANLVYFRSFPTMFTNKDDWR